MTCPHCQKTITYKQRTNWVCDLCKKEFAFEPSKNPLRLHDLRFRKVAEHVGAGGFKFTASQLGTALFRRPVATAAPRWVRCTISIFAVLLGFLIVVASMFVLSSKAKDDSNLSGVVLGIVIVLVASAFLVHALVSKPPVPPTDDTMRREILPRWQAIYGEQPRGLIDEADLARLTEEDRPRDNLLAVVVCPERGVLASLLANGVPRDLRMGLLSVAPPMSTWEKSLLEQLQKNPRLPILLLHDASAESVFLARDLPQILGLSADHRILDLGLNPRKSIEKNRTIIFRSITPELRARLGRDAVGADVAGSRPIRRGRAQVTTEEMKWLKAGNCSPILAVPPGSLVKRLKLALGKISPKKSVWAEVEALESVGFMS